MVSELINLSVFNCFKVFCNALINFNIYFVQFLKYFNVFLNVPECLRRSETFIVFNASDSQRTQVRGLVQPHHMTLLTAQKGLVLCRSSSKA